MNSFIEAVDLKRKLLTDPLYLLSKAATQCYIHKCSKVCVKQAVNERVGSTVDEIGAGAELDKVGEVVVAVLVLGECPGDVHDDVGQETHVEDERDQEQHSGLPDCNSGVGVCSFLVRTR